MLVSWVISTASEHPAVLMTGAGLAACLVLLLQYASTTSIYHKDQLCGTFGGLPPKYPTLVPYLGAIVPFFCDAPGYLKRATTYSGRLTSVRVALSPHLDICLFQDHDTIRQIWKQSRLLCDGRIHRWACKTLFGMPERFLAKYDADNSGPFPKPYPGSNVHPEMRIHRMMNMGNKKALTGSGFMPTMRRFKGALIDSLQTLSTSSEEWTQVEDLHELVHNTVGRSLILAIFGPGLFEVSPGIMDDLYEFNRVLPWLVRGVPKFLMPGPYAVRNRLQTQFKLWYKYAREHYHESCIYEDGDGDPYWGSGWMRERQEVLETLQDDDAMAAGDMGVAWASVENVVSATTMALAHIHRDPGLLDKIHAEITKEFGSSSVSEMDLKRLANIPLLASTYAETLRLHATSFTLISSSLQDTTLGRFHLPKGSIGLINARVAHMDEASWNTQHGLHPVGSFWAERFLIDPSGPTQGPMHHRLEPSKAPTFSTKGLEAAWVPYGGGQLICPGRFLAKIVMVFLCTLMTEQYDMEILTDRIRFSKGLFGFGVESPAHAIPVRVKRKADSLRRAT